MESNDKVDEVEINLLAEYYGQAIKDPEHTDQAEWVALIARIFSPNPKGLTPEEFIPGAEKARRKWGPKK